MLHDAFVDILEKGPNPPRIILLAPFNNAANPNLIKENLIQLLAGSNEDIMSINAKSASDENKITHDFQYPRISTSNKISPELKNENYIILTCPRNTEIFLDYCKVADIVCVIQSCKEAEQSTLLLDPFEHAKAFDELGYQMLTCLRAQGLPTVVGVLQDLELINVNKQNQVKKIYQRFFESELGEEKFISLNNNDAKTYFAFMRLLQEIPLKQLDWREIRSYFLTEKVQVNPENGILEVEGFLKGNYYNPNQLVHITGYGDFPVAQIDILHNPFMPQYKKEKLVQKLAEMGIEPNENVLMSFCANEFRESYDIFPDDNRQGLKTIKELDNGQEETKVEEDMNNKFEEEKMGNEDNNNNNEKIWDEAEEQFDGEDEEDDVSFEEDHTIGQMSNMQEEKKALRELAKRDEDEREFADEVDYPTNISLRERFKKYSGLKSFRTTEWNPYHNLPPEYSKILIFDDFNKSRKIAFEKAKADAVAYCGMYVKLYIEQFPLDSLASHDKEKPLVVSSLLKYERKLSVLNMKVKRHFESSEIVNSKENLELHLGFRIFPCRPIFSKIFAGISKSKFEKKTYRDQVYMASIYGEVTFPPANALFFKTLENGTKELVASGELMRPDPLRVILKRIILCGYPFKINKRKSVVRMMFFNPQDVNYFSPIELITKNGLRGHIVESLGTHGYMKCRFNSRIKGNDTVCLYLYKRVFPKWPFDPVQANYDSSEITSVKTQQ